LSVERERAVAVIEGFVVMATKLERRLAMRRAHDDQITASSARRY
jgi:hypothetical protein